MTKWRLLLTTLPFVAVVLLAKILLTHVLHYKGWLDFTDISVVLTAGVFLIGFMLAGTITDYKESEKLPAELAGNFETLEDTLEHVVSVNGKPIDRAPVMRTFRDMVGAVHAWLLGPTPTDKMFDSIHAVAVGLQDLEKQGVNPSIANKMNADLDRIRKTALRIDVIRRTGFLSTGYALLEMLIVLIVALLMIASFKTLATEVIVVTFVTMIYVYMYRLIRDIDDPFDYGADGKSGSAEVALFPIDEYIERFDKRNPALAHSDRA